jgi:hypothetical protein
VALEGDNMSAQYDMTVVDHSSTIKGKSSFKLEKSQKIAWKLPRSEIILSELAAGGGSTVANTDTLHAP